jgi:hypothetical protein
VKSYSRPDTTGAGIGTIIRRSGLSMSLPLACSDLRECRIAATEATFRSRRQDCY